MSRAKRVDANHRDILNFAKGIGITVWDTSSQGDGFPDSIFCVGGVNVLVEIKDGAKVKSKRKLTDAEAEFFANWPGPCEIVESVDDVLALREKYLVGAGE